MTEIQFLEHNDVLVQEGIQEDIRTVCSYWAHLSSSMPSSSACRTGILTSGQGKNQLLI